ncbi:NDP-sugar synthase [Candidatus Gracilibacteria bacterium]|nr:NDP-sugar synthase [Candidatus Gracilibacteria bacterium]
MKVLILAGGFATRLWPLTENRSKPLLLLNGETILSHIIKKIPQGLEIILLTNKRFELDFLKELQNIGRKKVKIFLEDSFSDGEKLGALGSLSEAIKYYKITENILVLAGDNLLPDLDITDLFCDEGESKLAVRELIDLHTARKFGVVELEKEGNRVVGFEEKPESPKSTLVSTGFLSIGKDLFPILHDFAAREPDALGGIFPEFLVHGKIISAVKVKGEWFDVGSFETYLEAHKKIQFEKLKKDSKVKEHGNQFLGKVFLGKGSEVKNSILIDTIVYPGTKLKNCRISNTIIDEDCNFSGLDLNQKLIRKNTYLHAENV